MPQEQATTQNPRHESAGRRVYEVLRGAIEHMPTQDVEALAGTLEEIVREEPIGPSRSPARWCASRRAGF